MLCFLVTKMTFVLLKPHDFFTRGLYRPKDNRRLVEAWLARRQRGGRGSGRGETPERVGPNSQKAVMGDLSLKVMEADKHSKHLTERADRDQRFVLS